jgi:hypothetical protein
MCRSWLRCVLTLGCVGFAVGSCAEHDPEATPSESIIYKGGGPFPSIAEANFLSELGSARTGLLAKCCDYISRNTPRTDDGPPAPSAESGAQYDEAAGSACIGQYHALVCPHGKEPPGIPASCRAAYTGGQLQAGVTCTTDWECEQSLVCGTSLGSEGLIRTCELPAQLLSQAGERCEAQNDCAPPMSCRDDGRCGLPQLGEACAVSSVYGDSCDKGFVCDRAGGGRCVQPTPIGRACTTNNECELHACIDGVCAQPVWGLANCTVH